MSPAHHQRCHDLVRLQIITNEFHHPRTQAVFNFVFSLPHHGAETSMNPYHITYRPVPDLGLGLDALGKEEEESVGWMIIALFLLCYHHVK